MERLLEVCIMNINLPLIFIVLMGFNCMHGLARSQHTIRSVKFKVD